MREPLRLVMQSQEENPMVYIAANALHMLGLTPDLREIGEVLEGEYFVDGDLAVYLLGKGLSIRTIWRYDPKQFLIHGPQHFRDISYERWTSEEVAMDEKLWTPEKRNYWRQKVQGWLEVFHDAGERKQQDIRNADINDVLGVSYTNALALVTLQPNHFETNPALVFAADEHGCPYIYCPAWGRDCIRAISRTYLQHMWKWSAGVQVIWR